MAIPMQGFGGSMDGGDGTDVTGVAPTPDPGAPPDPQTGSANNSDAGGFPLLPLVAAGAGIANYAGSQATNSANAGIAQSNNAFNAQQADAARAYDWQKASTGYQRTMADMKAAGLNPILAAGQGPEQGGSGIQASASGNPVMQNAIGQGVGSAMAGATLMNDLQSTKADILSKQANAAAATASASSSAASARLTDEQTAQMMDRDNSNKAQAIRDAGDATWQDQNRTARMLTTNAGIGSAITSSAQAGGDLMNWMLNGAPAKNMREAQALRDAGISGIPVQKQTWKDYYQP